MAWIESHQKTKEHPKTVSLRRRLRTSLPATIGHLHLFWWWALSYAEDGDISDIDDEIIAEACGWEGDASEFVQALISSGFVNEDRTIHDWSVYTHRIQKQREDNRVRQQRWRENNGLVTRAKRDSALDNALVTRDSALDNPATGPNRTGPNRTSTPPVVPPAAAGEDDGADAPPTAPQVVTKAPRAPKGTTVPDEFPLTDMHYAYAARCGVSREAADAETEKFLNHHRFKGTVGRNWYAGWQNWIRDSVGRFAPARVVNGGPPPRQPRPDDHLPSTVHRVPVERV